MSDTYFSHLETLIGKPDRIEREKARLDAVIREATSTIKARLTPATVPGLLWDLAMRDFRRMGPQTGQPVTDFAGQSRFLRALCAAVPFQSITPADDPRTDELLEICGALWLAMFHREMIDDLKTTNAPATERQRYGMAALTSLLSVVQGDLVYHEQVEARVRRNFGPFSTDIIAPALGLSMEEVLKGFQQVRSVLEERYNAAMDVARPMVERYEEWCRRSDAGASIQELDELGHAPETADAGRQLQEAFDGMQRLLVFTSEDLKEALGESSLAFLTAFSFQPGEVNAKIYSPTSEDTVRKRPFAHLGNGSYGLLDVAYSSFTPLRRLLDCFDTERRIQRLNKRRDVALEQDAVELFTAVVKPDLQLTNYYVELPDGRLAERDLLLKKGSCLFVIESKAKPLRPVRGRGDKIKRIASDVQESIQEGYDQACDVIRRTRSSTGAVELLDSNRADRKAFDTFDSSEITTIIPVVFLDSYYGLIASDLQPWLRVDLDIGYPWVTDRDTFESISMKIDNHETLRDFLLWRRTLHGRAHNEDEAVFAGFFLKHGAYDFPATADHVQLNACYADVFEAEYFRRKGMAVEEDDDQIRPPVISEMSRRGDQLIMKIDGQVFDSIDLTTGKSLARIHPAGPMRRGRSLRNSNCVCGSGKKFKKCCGGHTSGGDWRTRPEF